MGLAESLQQEEESFTALMQAAPGLFSAQLRFTEPGSLWELTALTEATIALCGLLTDTLRVRVHILEALERLTWRGKPEGLAERLTHERRHLNNTDTARRVRCLRVIEGALREGQRPPLQDWENLRWDALYRTALVKQLRDERPQLLDWVRDALEVTALTVPDVPSLSLEEAQLAIEANRTGERAHFKRINAELHVLTTPPSPAMTRQQFLEWCRALSALYRSAGKITSLRADIPALLLMIATDEATRSDLLSLSTTMGGAQVHWARRYDAALHFLDEAITANRASLSLTERHRACDIQQEARRLVIWLQGDDEFWFTIDGVLAGGVL